MALFGPQGIRDAIIKSYRKHFNKSQNQPLPEGTTRHQVALFGCLGTRYVASFKRKSEVELWLELTPFLKLEPEDGLSALAEYIVFKEMADKANISMLVEHLKTGLSLLSKEEQETLEPTARLNSFAWTTLV